MVEKRFIRYLVTINGTNQWIENSFWSLIMCLIVSFTIHLKSVPDCSIIFKCLSSSRECSMLKFGDARLMSKSRGTNRSAEKVRCPWAHCARVYTLALLRINIDKWSLANANQQQQKNHYNNFIGCENIWSFALGSHDYLLFT